MCYEPQCLCTDLAYQLALERDYINVIFGGGQRNFYPKNETLPSNTTHKGERSDGRNLAKEWLKMQQGKGRKAQYANSPDQFKDMMNQAENLDYAMGKSCEECLTPFI